MIGKHTERRLMLMADGTVLIASFLLPGVPSPSPFVPSNSKPIVKSSNKLIPMFETLDTNTTNLSWRSQSLGPLKTEYLINSQQTWVSIGLTRNSINIITTVLRKRALFLCNIAFLGKTISKCNILTIIQYDNSFNPDDHHITLFTQF